MGEHDFRIISPARHPTLPAWVQKAVSGGEHCPAAAAAHWALGWCTLGLCSSHSGELITCSSSRRWQRRAGRHEIWMCCMAVGKVRDGGMEQEASHGRLIFTFFSLPVACAEHQDRLTSLVPQHLSAALCRCMKTSLPRPAACSSPLSLSFPAAYAAHPECVPPLSSACCLDR